jgi:hypothetical protein
MTDLLRLVLLSLACYACLETPAPARQRDGAAPRLRVAGGRFVRPDGSPFAWRGITAFRLLEMMASGRQADVERYLSWAAAQDLTVVRVLVMARHLFELPPERGRAALPRLLELAGARGLYVEVVALADTASYRFDHAAHLKEVGAICARADNALLEVANEPFHPTQDERLQEGAYLERLARAVPREVPIALGAGPFESVDGGDYVTVHFPRHDDHAWAHVWALAEGAELRRRAAKPVISDEPIGASSVREPGRRDNAPERFRAAALLTRLAGLGATFHYEGGLDARIPTGRELECFQAWQEAWSLLPADVENRAVMVAPGAPDSPVVRFERAHAVRVFAAAAPQEAWALAIGVTGDPGIVWGPEWRAGEPTKRPGIWLVRARRQ